MLALFTTEYVVPGIEAGGTAILILSDQLYHSVRVYQNVTTRLMITDASKPVIGQVIIKKPIIFLID